MKTFREIVINEVKEIKTDIKQDGKVVGYIKIDKEDNIIRIADIEMTKSGTGLGTEAIRNIMKQADKDKNIVALTSDAMRGKANQKKNRTLYTKLGFTKNTGKNKLKEVKYEEFYYIGK